MTTPSKVTSPRRTRKTKSVALPKAIELTPRMIERHSRAQAFKEINAFIDTCTEVEMSIVRHIRPFNDPAGSMKEIRRLLGESIAKCKIIPFPAGGKRGVQIAKEA